MRHEIGGQHIDLCYTYVPRDIVDEGVRAIR